MQPIIGKQQANEGKQPVFVIERVGDQSGTAPAVPAAGPGTAFQSRRTAPAIAIDVVNSSSSSSSSSNSGKGSSSSSSSKSPVRRDGLVAQPSTTPKRSPVDDESVALFEELLLQDDDDDDEDDGVSSLLPSLQQQQLRTVERTGENDGMPLLHGTL